MRSTSPNSKAVIAASICAFVILLPTAAVFQTACGDTFTHKETGETFNGVIGDAKINDRILVIKEDGTRVYLDLGEYDIAKNDRGRPPSGKAKFIEPGGPTDEEAYDAVVHRNQAKAWGAGSARCTGTVKGHTSIVSSVAFSPDGSLLASGSWDDTTKLWNVATRQCVATLSGHTADVDSVAFSPDGNLLASGSRDNAIKLWDVRARRCVATLNGHTSYVWSVAFTPDGSLLASGSVDKTIKLWDVATRQCVATLSGHTNYVISVAFSPDGSFLASGSGDKTIKLWDVATRQCVATLSGRGSLSGRLLSAPTAASWPQEAGT